jgi:hypothetical protein
MNLLNGTILALLLLLMGQYNIPRRTGATAASAGGSGISFVSGATHGCFLQNGSGTTVACTVSAAVANHTLVVFTGSTDVFGQTLADSGSGTLAACTINPFTWNFASTTNGRASCFTIANAGAGSHTLTTTFSSSVNNPWIQVLEFSGANTTTPQDVSKGGTGTGGTTMDSGALTTGHANEMLVAFCQIGAGGVTVVPGTGFTLVSTTSSNIASEYLFESTIASYHGTCTGQTSTQDWVVTMVALKP